MQNPPLLTFGLAAATVGVLGSIGLSAFLSVVHANLFPQGSTVFMAAQLFTLLTVAWLITRLIYELTVASSTTAKWIVLVLLTTVVGCAAYMASGVFSWHDELYSWNLWAIQHFQGLPYDQHYTQAAYPQAYAYWLASIYGAQGQFLSQWGTRLASSIPILLLLGCAVALWQPSVTARVVAAQTGITALAFLSMYKNLLTGYADPLMSAALAVSLLALLCYSVNVQRLGWLLASVGAAVLAAYTKQPAVLWACGSLPLIALAGKLWWGWPWRAVAIAVTGALLAAFGTFVVTSNISDNEGVISRALGDQSVVQTLLTSVYRYLIKRPLILLLLAGSWWAVRRDRFLHLIWWAALPPMIGLWFTLGSYESRHGIHCVWWAALLWLAALKRGASPTVPGPPAQAIMPGQRRMRWLAAVGGTVVTLAGVGVVTKLLADHRGTDLHDGQKTAFAEQMGTQNAGAFFAQRVAKQSHVFTTSNYSWGLFYGRLPVSRAAIHHDISTDIVGRLLQKNRADYAIASGQYAFGRHSELLLALAAQCPSALQPTMRSSDGIFTVFAVALPELSACID